MSLDYPVPNPLPVTLVDGSVIEITNLGDIEAILTAVAANTASIDGKIESVERAGETLTKTTNLTAECLLVEVVLQLRINNAYNAILVNEVITEQDLI